MPVRAVGAPVAASFLVGIWDGTASVPGADPCRGCDSDVGRYPMDCPGDCAAVRFWGREQFRPRLPPPDGHDSHGAPTRLPTLREPPAHGEAR
jgi:hypothetical protein